MEVVIVGFLGFLGTCLTAWLAYKAQHEAKQTKQEMQTGNGASAGTYLTKIDRTLTVVNRRLQRVEDYLGLNPIPSGGADDEMSDA